MHRSGLQIAIANRIEDKYMFPDCVGLVDGTLNALEFRPETPDAPE
jgi:hypothetical protein